MDAKMDAKPIDNVTVGGEWIIVVLLIIIIMIND